MCFGQKDVTWHMSFMKSLFFLIPHVSTQVVCARMLYSLHVFWFPPPFSTMTTEPYFLFQWTALTSAKATEDPHVTALFDCNKSKQSQVQRQNTGILAIIRVDNLFTFRNWEYRAPLDLLSFWQLVKCIAYAVCSVSYPGWK